MGREKENHREIGTVYENKAVLFLQEKGFQILERNFYTRFGEIDIIAMDRDYLVFVEVKYRRNADSGVPAEAVTLQKQRHIRMTAQYYLYSRRYGDIPCRFDVVSILAQEIQWIKDAF